VRYAVAVGLEALVRRMDPLPPESQRAVSALQALAEPEREETPVVRLRASMACSRLLDGPPPPLTP
jgi:hypothetical protein